MFNPQPPQHPACGSARGVSFEVESRPMNLPTPKLVTTTGRHRDFTWSGAVPRLRPVRLTLCRRFRPSPCPTHYGRRWATTPSADFCPITPRVTTGRAVRLTVGSVGFSTAFAMVLSPAPMASSATLGFGGQSTPFELGLSPTPLAARTACRADLPE